MKYEKFWKFQNSMRAVTINSEFSLPGLTTHYLFLVHAIVLIISHKTVILYRTCSISWTHVQALGEYLLSSVQELLEVI